MSAPADKKALDELNKIVEKNDAAGGWLYSSPPGVVVPIPVKEPLSSTDIVTLAGKKHMPPKK